MLKSNATQRIEGLVRMRPFAEWTKIVGNRGSAGSTPENTLMAIREAAELGTRAIQVDVRLTRDGVPVLFRDETLERTTNGNGPISDIAYDNLKQLDAGSWFLPQFSGEPVPSLADALRLCAMLDLRILPQIRPVPGAEYETARAVLRTFEELWPLDRSMPLVCSTSPEILEAAAGIEPEWPRGLIFEDFAPPANWRDIVTRTQPITLQGNARNPTALLELVASGKPVYASTVNDVKRARSLFAIGIFGIITDYPAQMSFQHVQVMPPG